MKKLPVSIMLVVVLLLVISTSTEAQSIEELRENGTLLLLFVASVFGAFYLFGIILLFATGATEKKLDSKKNKNLKPTTTLKRKINPNYSIPYAHSFISNRQLRPRKKRA